MIDTHCHLTSPQLASQLNTVLSKAHDAGIKGMITVSTCNADCASGLQLTLEHPNIWCTAGIHPHSATEEPDWELVRSVASDPHCVAWGELGLDWYYREPSREEQMALVRAHLDVIQSAEGRAADLPIVLHCRDAYEDLVGMLRESSIDTSRCVFHCFTGNTTNVRMVLDLGAWVSFTGIVTFQNAKEIQEAAQLVPLDRLMVETDSPYLSPEPVRTMRPNEPCNVIHTARFLAQLRGQDEDTFFSTLDDNATRCYGLEF